MWKGNPTIYEKELLEYPSKLGGLQLHNLERFAMSPKRTRLIRRILTNSSGTIFAYYNKIRKCLICGSKYLDAHIDKTKNLFWKEVIQPIYELRKKTKPLLDFEYLSWPLWYDDVIEIPMLRKLEKKNVLMASDLLDPIWNILSKEEIEKQRNVSNGEWGKYITGHRWANGVFG